MKTTKPSQNLQNRPGFGDENKAVTLKTSLKKINIHQRERFQNVTKHYDAKNTNQDSYKFKEFNA